MRLIKINKISYKQADELLEKYYEGKTTCDEENLLRKFLMQKKLPAVYDTEKAIFGYFENRKSAKPRFVLHRSIFQSAAAAVAIILIGFIMYKNIPENKNYAYVDGKKITNSAKVESLASSSLNSISAENSNMMEEQLNQFSNIGF
ncbi:conserved hypothetical protein [uncultured Paludibacter sp.]|uniref:Uncharacterized protein n=1 Tax=uncultured Paludibacter sp. TaxID=497635 RepID=A0A653AAM2_9BACT|nr:conserved hypothetical protein [uncultured Paludibacter sp.]